MENIEEPELPVVVGEVLYKENGGFPACVGAGIRRAVESLGAG